MGQRHRSRGDPHLHHQSARKFPGFRIGAVGEQLLGHPLPAIPAARRSRRGPGDVSGCRSKLEYEGADRTRNRGKGGDGGYGSLVGGETINDLITGCPATSTNQCAPFFLSPAFAISAGTYTVTSPGTSAVGALSAPIT